MFDRDVGALTSLMADIAGHRPVADSAACGFSHVELFCAGPVADGIAGQFHSSGGRGSHSGWQLAATLFG
ncbi:hypothetical protein [Streptomyces sp. LMG1-1-1.1]|uniref:hypothetical protein n=1 Tax=Streptomyces sp. LMG1-1-1.1 TaxID=3135245 RepID=UPI00346514AD